MQSYLIVFVLALLPFSASARTEAQQQLVDQFIGTGFESLNGFCDLPKTCMGIAPDKTSHRRHDVGADHHLVDTYEQTCVSTGLVLKYSFPVGKVKVGASAANLDVSEHEAPRFRHVLVVSRIWDGWQGVRVGATRAYVEGLLGPEDKKSDSYGCSVYRGPHALYEATICYHEENVLTLEWERWGND